MLIYFKVKKFNLLLTKVQAGIPLQGVALLMLISLLTPTCKSSLASDPQKIRKSTYHPVTTFLRLAGMDISLDPVGLSIVPGLKSLGQLRQLRDSVWLDELLVVYMVK